MRRVVWSDEAVRNLENISAYIGDFSPLAAQRMALKLISAGNSLSDYAERGRSLGRGRRELVTVPPYLIRYRVMNEVVEIISVRHGARRPAPQDRA